jgi:hypothetical protein
MAPATRHSSRQMPKRHHGLLELIECEVQGFSSVSGGVPRAGSPHDKASKKRHQGRVRLFLHRFSSFNFLLGFWELNKLVLHPRQLLAGWLPRSHIGGSPGQRLPMCSWRRNDHRYIVVRVGQHRRSGVAAGGAPKAAMCWRHPHSGTMQGLCRLLQGAQFLACTPSLRHHTL